MLNTEKEANREEVIADADAKLEAAGLPTYSQLLATVESMATEECAA